MSPKSLYAICRLLTEIRDTSRVNGHGKTSALQKSCKPRTSRAGSILWLVRCRHAYVCASSIGITARLMFLLLTRFANWSCLLQNALGTSLRLCTAKSLPPSALAGVALETQDARRRFCLTSCLDARRVSAVTKRAWSRCWRMY